MTHGRDHRSGLAGWLLVACLATFAVLVGWFASMSSGSLAPTPPGPEAGVMAEGPVGAPPAQAAATGAGRVGGLRDDPGASRDAVDAREPGIYVHVLDSSGASMPGFRVKLDPRRRISVDSLDADAGGWCAFPGKPKGSFELTTQPFACVRKEFAYDGVGVLEVEFRMPQGMVAVLGRCTRSGQLEQRQHVLWRQGGEWAAGGFAQQGVHRMVLPEGANQLGLAGAFGAEYPCYTWTQPIPRGLARHEYWVEVPCSDLAVEVTGPTPLVVEGGTVRLVFDPDGVAMPLQRALSTKAVLLFTWLPAGEYEVSVRGPRLVAPVSRRITILQLSRRERLRIAVRAGTSLALKLATGGKALVLERDHGLPRLFAPGGPEQGLGGRLPRRRPGSRRCELLYEGVPPGPVELRSADRVVGEEWQYLAYEPIEAVGAQVQLGEVGQLVLAVHPRALVDLRACEKHGRESFRASIEVFAGERRVQSYPVRGCQRFRSHMPAGDYRVVIDRGGTIQECVVTVARKDLRLRLRP